MIGIRADANNEIATGHIMRCMSIGTQLVNMGEEIVFLVADLYAKDILEERRFPYICLCSDWKNKKDEIPNLKRIIEQNKIEVLLLDSYEVTSSYMQNLRKITRLVYMDDLYAFPYGVDAIINDAVGVKEEMYPYASENGTQLWLGTPYISIREEFRNKYIDIHTHVKNIIFTTGGADQEHVCQSFLQYILEKNLFPDITFHIVVGKFFTQVELLEQLQRSRTGVILHKNVKRMSEIMMQCDMAISAGGNTLNELCVLGIPTICFSTADNQVEGIQMFADKKLMLTNGDVRDNPGFFDCLIKQVDRLMVDYDLRKQMSEREKAMIDGNGAYRIAKNLIELKS